MEKVIKVMGMHCSSCEMLLVDSLSEIQGVSNSRADFKKGTVTVVIAKESLLKKVYEVITKEGYVVKE